MGSWKFHGCVPLTDPANIVDTVLELPQSTVFVAQWQKLHCRPTDADVFRYCCGPVTLSGLGIFILLLHEENKHMYSF